MGLVRAFEEDDYLPEYGLLVVVDPSVDWDPGEDPVMPHHRDRGDMPTGSFAGAGGGWITCRAGGEAVHEVRIELHDAAPAADHADFDDVLETPYRSSSGGLTLTTLTGGGGRPYFDLGDSGWFRVRVARRRSTTGDWPLDQWLLRFWPELRREPPVRLARADRLDYLGGLAEDVEAVLRWTTETPLDTTASALAGRLLISEESLSRALALAQQRGQLHVDVRDGGLRLWLGPRPGREPAEPVAAHRSAARPSVAEPSVDPSVVEASVAESPVAPAESEPAGVAVPPEIAALLAGTLPPELVAALGAASQGGNVTVAFGGVADATGHLAWSVPGRRPEQPAGPPFGAPPRAGLVETNGAVVVWRDGVRTELARVPVGERIRAWETRHGVLVAGHQQPAWLISATGDVTEIDGLAMPMLRLLGDGRRVAVLDSHHHRRVSRHRLRVVDLADGSTETLPWPEHREIGLLGTYRDTVLFSDRDDPAATSVTMRWVPGNDPQRHERAVLHVDLLTGVSCAPVAGGVTVDRPDGTSVTVAVPRGLHVQPAPGGERLWAMGSTFPPEFHLLPVAAPGEAPRVWRLPDDGYSSVRQTYATPIWEDTGHVLIAHEPRYRPGEPSVGLRLSAADGAMQRLPPTGSNHRAAALITPLLTP